MRVNDENDVGESDNISTEDINTITNTALTSVGGGRTYLLQVNYCCMYVTYSC
jgi:hypothetical protein